MAISSEIPIYPVSQDAFDEVDAAVMQCAYAAQNHFGRLCEEEVYENDVKSRLKEAGFDVHTQVKLLVSHEKLTMLLKMEEMPLRQQRNGRSPSFSGYLPPLSDGKGIGGFAD